METPEPTNLECFNCGNQHPFSLTIYVCPVCRGKLFVNYDYKNARAALESTLASAVALKSLWRYVALLPVNGEQAVLQRVGGTPLYEVKTSTPVALLFKDDTANPSGSIKDRANAVAISCALAAARNSIAVASTGNAAVSLACLGAATPLSVRVYVPWALPAENLIRMRMYGADVRVVEGNYDEAYRECMVACEEDPSIQNRNTAHNPFTREGKKTCAFEIWEEMNRRVPEWVIVPVGDGNVLSGVWKGFHELQRMGLAARVPRLVAAQHAQSNVISRCFLSGEDPRQWRPASRMAGGIASSLRVQEPADLTGAVFALKKSAGLAVMVDDIAILHAMSMLADAYGLFVEPAAAASYASFLQLAARGTFAHGERVVCLLTGSGLNSPQAARTAFEHTNGTGGRRS